MPRFYYSLFTIFLACISHCFTVVYAQSLQPYQVFCVELTDKDNTPYTLLRGHDFLSPRALARRLVQGIALDETDLPLVPAYLAEIEKLGAKITNRSKWLNAVAIYAPDSAMREKIKLLPFVRRIFPLGYYREPKASKTYRRIIRDTTALKPDYYGFGANQAYMLDAPRLHAAGFSGKGIHVAIFDGGFENAYRMPAFDSLYERNQILGTWDFVEGDEYVYEDSGHGTDVLSCMAANMPYLLVGTAPDASYYLFKTEDTKGEFWIEEFNWVAAAERADSLGVDVINSSLGYTTFRDTMMNYKYAQDLDGKTSIAARGADIAVLKGIVVVNSAGNEGNKKWHYIGTPADGYNVLAVGATRSDGTKAAFSSIGPSTDGRIKPNLSAQGQDAYVASLFGFAVKTTSGTSFSSPILAGAIASLRQAYPNIYSLDFKRAMEADGTQADNPDSLLGYGIPQLLRTYIALKKGSLIVVSDRSGIFNRQLCGDELEIWTQVVPMSVETINIEIRNSLQEVVYTLEETYKEPKTDLRTYRINTRDLAQGVYSLRLVVGNKKMFFSIWKN
jgi:serine protease AprX